MKLKIESGIPAPDKRSEYKVVFDKMKAGDSFVVDKLERRNRAYNVGSRLGHKITSKKIDGVGYRVWLLKRAESFEC